MANDGKLDIPPKNGSPEAAAKSYDELAGELTGLWGRLRAAGASGEDFARLGELESELQTLKNNHDPAALEKLQRQAEALRPQVVKPESPAPESVPEPIPEPEPVPQQESTPAPQLPTEAKTELQPEPQTEPAATPASEVPQPELVASENSIDHKLWTGDDMSPPGETTRKEWRDKFRNTVMGAKEFFGQVKDSAVEMKDSALEKVEKSMAYVRERSSDLGDSIAEKVKAGSESIKGLDAGKEKFDKLKKFLADEELSKTEKLKIAAGKTGEGLLAAGEWYRKLPLKYKLAVSGALIGASLATGGASTFVTVISAAKLGQRSLAAAGIYNLAYGLAEKRYATMEAKGIARNKWEGWIKHGHAAAAAAIVFSGLPGAAIREVFEVSGAESGLSWLYEHAHSLVAGNHLAQQVSAAAPPPLESVAASASQAQELPIHPDTVSEFPKQWGADKPFSLSGAPHPLDLSHDQMPGAKDIVIEHPAAPAPELPTIEGGTHGYEGMIQELYARLHAPGANYVLPADHTSDLYKIMTADKADLGKIAHQLAANHMNVGGIEQHGRGFFETGNAASPNVLIEKGSTLGFDSHGNLSFNQGGHSAPIENAAAGAKTTPALGEHHELNQLREKLGITPKAPETATLAPETPAFPHGGAESNALNASEQARLAAHVPVEQWDYDHAAPLAHPEAVGPQPAEHPIATPHVEDGSRTFLNVHEVPVDPDATHVYESPRGLYVFGGKVGGMDDIAQDYVKAHGVPVFIDKSTSFLGIRFPQVIEYAPNPNGGPPTMTIHHEMQFIPDPQQFTKRAF